MPTNTLPVNVTLPVADSSTIRSSKFAELMYLQTRNSTTIPAYNFGWSNGTVNLTANRTFSVEEGPRLANTYFDVVVDPFAGVRVGYQTNGSDISVWERGGNEGVSEWSIPVY